MKLTKFGHSCVLVEGENESGDHQVALFDPGTWNSLPLETINRLDMVYISHIHPDHCDPQKIYDIVAKFPDVRIYAPDEVMTMLRDKNVLQCTDTVPDGAVTFTSPHEDMRPLGSAPPEEIGIHFLGKYTHPGDSHSFHETKAILGLPIVAPWGSTRRAAELAIELKPQYVLPIHDWFLRPEAKVWMYGSLSSMLAPYGITVLQPEDGVMLEVDV